MFYVTRKILSSFVCYWLGLVVLLASYPAHGQWKPASISPKKIRKELRPKKMALLFGIGRFQNSHWETLKYTSNDTLRVASELRETANFDRILVRNTSGTTTRSSLISALHTLKRLVKSHRDTVVLYISAHGTVAYSPRKKTYDRFIVTSDTTRNVSKTALSVSEILSILKTYTSQRIVLILATCYTGPAYSKSRRAPGTKGQIQPSRPLDSRAVQILSATGYAQPAFESPLLKGDVYTHYFLRCLRKLKKSKKSVSAIEAHICAAKPTTLFVKKHRSEIQVPRVDSQPGANRDIVLASVSPVQERRGYFAGRWRGRQSVRYHIRPRMRHAKSRPSDPMEFQPNEMIALRPGSYEVTIRNGRGEVIGKRYIDIHDGRVTRWNGDYRRPLPKRGYRRAFVGGDFAPFVGTSLFTKGRAIRNFSLNIGGGLAAGIEGLEIGAGFNIIKDYVLGGQIAGGFNLVRRELWGLQIAGGFNIVGNEVWGAQLAGGFNFSANEVWGGQLSGGVNVAGGNIKGLQISGGVNMAKGDLLGAQVTGGINLAIGNVTGIQVSGGVNMAKGHLFGAQVTGGVNIADSMFGIQLAPVNILRGRARGLQLGVVNIAKGRVRGLQLGVVNVAHRSNMSLGVVNIVRDGRTHLDTWVSSTGFFKLAFKHGGDHFHSIYFLGFSPFNEGAWSAGLGLGWHMPLTSRFYLDIDLLSEHVNQGRGFTKTLNTIGTARASIGFRLFSKVAIFAGLSYKVLASHATRGDEYARFADTIFVDACEEGDLMVRGWPSFNIGLQFFAGSSPDRRPHPHP